MTSDPKYSIRSKDQSGDCMLQFREGAEYHCCGRKLYKQSQVYGLLDWDLVATGTETTAIVVGIFHLSQYIWSAVHDKWLQQVSVRKIYKMGQEKLYEPYSLQWEGKDGKSGKEETC